MHDRTKIISAVAALGIALAAGGGVALASGAGGKPSSHAKTASASQKAGKAKSAGEQRGHDDFVALVAEQLHLSATSVSAALAPIFAAGHADPASPSFAAAARALGVSTGQLAAALTHAKLSIAGAAHASQSPAGSKSAPASKAADERRGHEAFVVSVAAQLHLSATSVSAALAPIFAAGHADPASPSFAAAARALGVSTGQLAAALTHAKLSMAGGS
jgi:hypothetical protein